jgi:hypothetical protein
MATLIFKVEGHPEIRAGMIAKYKAIGNAVSRGLRKAGIDLQGRSMRMVPVDYGILKASAFTRHTGSSFQTVVNTGYTAAYAFHVHQRFEMKWKGLPRGSGPEFKTFTPLGEKKERIYRRRKTNQHLNRGHYWDPQGRAKAGFLSIPFRDMIRDKTLNRFVYDEVRREVG